MVSTALILIALNVLLVLNSYLFVLNVFNNIYMVYFKWDLKKIVEIMITFIKYNS